MSMVKYRTSSATALQPSERHAVDVDTAAKCPACRIDEVVTSKDRSIADGSQNHFRPVDGPCDEIDSCCCIFAEDFDDAVRRSVFIEHEPAVAGVGAVDDGHDA